MCKKDDLLGPRPQSAAGDSRVDCREPGRPPAAARDSRIAQQHRQRDAAQADMALLQEVPPRDAVQVFVIVDSYFVVGTLHPLQRQDGWCSDAHAYLSYSTFRPDSAARC